MSTIQLRTSIPGPRSQALMNRRHAAVVQAAFHATPVFVAKAEGAVVEDVDGNRLIDFAGGIGCLNTGHRAPAVVEAVRRQLDRFLHTSFNVLPYESYIAVCEKLNALVPGKGPKKTVLVNTGAEAGRECHQDRALLHEAAGDHLLRGRVSRPHLYGDGGDQQDASVQSGIRAVSERGVPHSLCVLLPLLVLDEVSVVRRALREAHRRHV